MTTRLETFDAFATRASVQGFAPTDSTSGSFGLFSKLQRDDDGPTYGLKIIRFNLEPVIPTPRRSLWTAPGDFANEIMKVQRLSSIDGFCDYTRLGDDPGPTPRLDSTSSI